MPLALLGTKVGSAAWQAFLAGEDDRVEVRRYPDTYYYNLRPRGISFQVDPATSTISTIDLYNAQARWGSYDQYPVEIPIVTDHQNKQVVQITPETTAIELVRAFGEPTRKGGAEAGGPTTRALGPAMWTEWKVSAAMGTSQPASLYVLAEYAGEAARAPDRWERGRGSDARWATIALSIVAARE